MPPLTFLPIVKRIRWGGRRLGSVLKKPIGEGDDYAESWEVVDHGEDQSVVSDAAANGRFAGQTLSELVRTFPAELFGADSGREQFPLLIKFLDASDRLSVQVHPNDALAKRHDPAELGKTEAWVILHAEAGARLWSGLKEGVTEEQVRSALEQQTLEDLLHAVEVKSGDCVFIPAGTVHAIGEGILLAEVQQSSDLTFRYYDWGRLGADGQPRELHIDDSLEATDWTRGPVDPVTPQPATSALGCERAEHLVHCEFFDLTRHFAQRETTIPQDGQSHTLLVLDGSATLSHSLGQTRLPTGQTVLLPADRDSVVLRPDEPTTILDATLN